MFRNKSGRFGVGSNAHKKHSMRNANSFVAGTSCSDGVDEIAVIEEVAVSEHEDFAVSEHEFEEEPEHADDPLVDMSWQTGRRVVELSVLADNMYCDVCKSPLHLSNTIRERRLGLGSTLHIKCSSVLCTAICQVDTGKRGASGSFDVNSKAALGIYCYLYVTCACIVNIL